MAAPPVGLDITASSLAAVSLVRKGKAYSVTRRAEAALPPGVVVDGEVRDVAALAAALRTFWSEAGIAQRSVAIGVANQRCVTRTFDMVRIRNRKQLRDAISFEVADNLPIPVEQAIWDFHTVSTYKDEAGVERQRHVVVMVYRESVEAWQEAVTAAGLKLVRIDLAAFALMRAGLPGVKIAIAAEGIEEEPVVAMLDVGSMSTNVVISHGDVCELNRIVAFGANHFPDALVEQFGWSAEDAARVSGEAGIEPLGGVEAADDPYADARRVQQYVVEQYAQELRTSFDYFTHSTGGARQVGRVVIAGGGAGLRGLAQRLGQELGVPVSSLDPSSRLDTPSVEDFGADLPRYGTALGLAMDVAA